VLLVSRLYSVNGRAITEYETFGGMIIDKEIKAV
jgi:hypothetical protein